MLFRSGYYYVDFQGVQQSILKKDLIDDGHPTIFNKYMVTDTYPDHNCRSKLFLVDLEKNTSLLLGSFLSFRRYRGVNRCDLHPRFDSDGKGITFDSVCDVRRMVYHLDLSKIIDN